MSATVLVVDDDATVRYTLRAILEDQRLAVVEAADGSEAIEQIRSRPEIELVLTDLSMPVLDGLGLLRALENEQRHPPVVMITARGSERTAVEAMKLGALDYFVKPFNADDIVQVVTRSLRSAALEQENHRLRAGLVLGRTMVFDSPAMLRVAEMVERVGARNVTVLLTGESGTGKELVARALVEASPRAGKPFVRFNCAALTRELAEAELFGHRRGAFTGATRDRVGIFREANGGTLLLDEVDSLDALTQAALLRVIQEREVRPVGEERSVPIDVRLIAATGRNLATVPSFRRDLLYRLQVVVISLPPLRDRREDIVPLARHFARRFGERFGVGPVVLDERLLARLHAAPWPGNVRELENTIERLVALAPGPHIDERALDEPDSGPTTHGGEMTLKERVDVFERAIIAECMDRCGQNQSEAARRLGLNRATLISKLKKYGLHGAG